MAIRVVTDSSADLPTEVASRHNITVVPCSVIIDDVTYRDGVDLSADEFYARLTSNTRLPTTAQPSIADFTAVYQELLSQGHQIISVHVSGKLSGTVNAAQQAAVSLGEDAPIRVIDSRLASLGLGLVTLAAAELGEIGGESLEGVEHRVIEDLPLTQAFFVLDTLEYLHKGGRIGKANAFLGSLLNVKPILKVQDGEVHPVERQRSWDRALRRLVELLEPLAPVRRLAVLYSTEREPAEYLCQRLAHLAPDSNIITARFGATLGTYLGPKAVGIAVTSER